MLVAHGVGTRSDLPISTSFAAVGAALVLVISFGVLALLWRKPRFAGTSAGRPLPRMLTWIADSAVVRTGARSLALLGLVLVCAIGFLGAPESGRNLVPWAFYVTFWVGLVPASLLFGPVWRVLNPLRLLQSGLAGLLRVDRRQGRWVLPPQVGYWPAAVSLGVFAWFELVYPAGSEPRAVAVLILGYAVVHTAAGVCLGSEWFDRGDGFEVYSTLLGALAPISSASLTAPSITPCWARPRSGWCRSARSWSVTCWPRSVPTTGPSGCSLPGPRYGPNSRCCRAWSS